MNDKHEKVGCPIQLKTDSDFENNKLLCYSNTWTSGNSRTETNCGAKDPFTHLRYTRLQHPPHSIVFNKVLLLDSSYMCEMP